VHEFPFAQSTTDTINLSLNQPVAQQRHQLWQMNEVNKAGLADRRRRRHDQRGDWKQTVDLSPTTENQAGDTVLTKQPEGLACISTPDGPLSSTLTGGSDGSCFQGSATSSNHVRSPSLVLIAVRSM